MLHSEILGPLDFSHYRTVSPRLGDNCVLKCSSDSFPHSTYLSACEENSQNRTLMFLCSPILERRLQTQEKLRDRFVPQFPPHFMTFSPQLEIYNALECSSHSFPRMVISILCVANCQNYILTHSCLPIAGRLFYNVKKCH